MFGKILGKIISTPVRLVNVPLQVVSKAADSACGYTRSPAIKDRDPIGLGEVADAIDKACNDE